MLGRKGTVHAMRIFSALTAAVLLTSCAQVITGSPVSGEVSLTSVSNGMRDDAPAPTITVENTDDGSIDVLAATALEDVMDFWNQTPLPQGMGMLDEPKAYYSYDSMSREDAKTVCGQFTFRMVNAAYCKRAQAMMWDRGKMLPMLKRVGGDMAVAFVMAHEMGHHVQTFMDPQDITPTLVAESQADCYAGAYLGWVSEGSSRRFRMSADGAGEVLRVVSLAGDSPHVIGETAPNHGTSVERVWALQRGLMRGVDACATITERTIGTNRAGVPLALSIAEAESGGNAEFTAGFVQLITDSVNAILPTNRPVQVGDTDCRLYDRPFGWCGSEDSVYAPPHYLSRHINDMQSGDVVGRIGDGTVIGGLINTLSQQWIASQGVQTRGVQAGYRSACVVGAVTRVMADQGNPKNKVQFSAGDADEVLTDLLYDGFTAMDADGTVASGIFERSYAFVNGLFNATGPRDCLVTYP